MFQRLRQFRISGVHRNDLLLMTVAVLSVLAICAIWAVLLVGQGVFTSLMVSRLFLLAVFFGAAAVVALVPFFTWARQEDHRIARAIVRAGIALQLFAVVTSVIALAYATDPTRSVPVGYVAFTAILIGVLVAGFAGNALAPAEA